MSLIHKVVTSLRAHRTRAERVSKAEARSELVDAMMAAAGALAPGPPKVLPPLRALAPRRK